MDELKNSRNDAPKFLHVDLFVTDRHEYEHAYGRTDGRPHCIALHLSTPLERCKKIFKKIHRLLFHDSSFELYWRMAITSTPSHIGI